MSTLTKSREDRRQPQFKRMFEDASKRKFDHVLFWALDRFSREGTLETLQHLQKLSAWGVGWRSYQESYLDSCGPFAETSLCRLWRRWLNRRGFGYQSARRRAYSALEGQEGYLEGHGLKWM